MSDSKPLDGKLALVTGASRGIGAATAEALAREVHMRIASPPTRHSCFYGVDTPERAKLLAAQMSVEGMADYINADSLAFISIDGLYRALGDQRNAQQPQRCDACFTGEYPTPLTDHEEVDQFALLDEPIPA